MFDNSLRPPLPLDPQAPAYKDWLHLNLLDHASGSIGLINVSLHGEPSNPNSRAVGTALVHVPGLGWIGNLEVRGLSEAAIGSASIGLERVAMAFDNSSGTVLASVRDPEHHLNIRVEAKMAVPPMLVEQQLSLGHGWMSWFVAPRLIVAGEWTVGREHRDLRATSAYHDHNWGRWYWGDDLGWEWGCFLTAEPNTTFSPISRISDAMLSSISVVFSLTTDRAHRYNGQPSLTVYANHKRRTFPAPAIRLDYGGKLDEVERRVPGALAALHQDHIQVQLPKRLTIYADDGLDHLTLEFTARSAAQLITGDPIVRGYSFIHEIAGDFKFVGRLANREISGAGLGMYEYVC